MVQPYRDKNGALRARKRIPNAVRDEYARLYGVRHEAKFYARADIPTHEQRRLFSEWLSTVEGQIGAIIAARNGHGIALTPRDARALAGEWYEWFVGRHPGDDPGTWEELRDNVHDAFSAAVHDADLENALKRDGDAAVWKSHPELREAVRPTLADIGETAQFLAIELVGDLIRHIETWGNEKRRRGAAPVFRGPHVARVLKPAKQQESCDEAALFFLRLAGDLRSLTGWCRETRQPVDLQLYVDDATMARIWSNVLHFQCPHCGTKHETEVQRLAAKPFSLEPLKRNAQGGTP